ncbi:hypothetical protein ACVIST_002927 [Bradyrhizobium elkanii]
MTTANFESLKAGDTIDGPTFAVSRESIRLFCDASLDYNPLHLDDNYMKGDFGKTNFGGIIMHGMNNFGLISRMLTDWALPAGRDPSQARDALAEAGEARRHHPPGRYHQGQANDREVALGAGRRRRTEPARRDGRGRRSDAGVSAEREGGLRRAGGTQLGGSHFASPRVRGEAGTHRQMRSG